MINSLTIRNFKAFSNHKIPLRPLTLLSGLNGMGKSTAIQALLLLRQSFEQRMLPEIGLALNGELVQIGTGQDAQFDGTRAEDEATDEIVFELETADYLRASWHFGAAPGNDVLALTKDRPNEDIYNLSLFSDNFVYLYAERVGPRTSFDISDYKVRDHRQLGVNGEYTAHFLNLYQDETVMEALQHPDALGVSLREQVEAWMSEVSPGIQFDLQAYQKIDRVQVSISYPAGKDVRTNFYRPTNVGFGIMYVLPIVVAILSSAPGALLLIENPEAHLHPRGQSLLGSLIARAADAGLQIVVETHSDHILNGIRIAVRNRIIEEGNVAVHYFSRDLANPENRSLVVSSPELDKYGKLNFWPEGFFDEFGKSLDELL